MKFEIEEFRTRAEKNRRAFGDLDMDSMYKANADREEEAAVPTLSFDDLAMGSLYQASAEEGEETAVAELAFDKLDLKDLFANRRPFIDLDDFLSVYSTMDWVVHAINSLSFMSGIASLFESSFSVNESAWILNESNIATVTLASILENDQLSAGKAALIISHSNLSAEHISNALDNSTMTGDRVQEILQHSNMDISPLIDIMVYGQNNATIPGTATSGSVQRLATLTVNSGATLTLTGEPGIIICGALTNNGTIKVDHTGIAGGTTIEHAGVGGDGGGGLIILCKELDNNSIIHADGEAGTPGSTTTQYSAEGGDVNGTCEFQRITTDVIGGGGDGGYLTGASVYGGGGGGVTLTTTTQGGDGGDAVDYTTFSDADGLKTDILDRLIDWYIQQVLLKTLTVPDILPTPQGTGGGGGAESYYHEGCSGGGGGGGGSVLVVTTELDNAGTIRADGGDGGTVGSEGAHDGCGGGGGGGIVYVLYETLTATGTLQANGGAGQSGDQSNGHSVAGTAGTAATHVIT